MERRKFIDNKKIQKSLLIFLILLLMIIDYPFFNKIVEDVFFESEFGIIERVIDGDTVVIENESIRLLGINSPEKNEVYYQEAKDYLELMVLNRTVKLIKTQEDRDRYNRKLRYLILGTTNINLELVKKGYANFYFPSGKDKYYKEFKTAWEKCIEEDKNLCEISKQPCAKCINLKEFNLNSQLVVLKNSCSFYCDLKDWSIKDEGRKIFNFPSFILKNTVSIKVGDEENEEDVLFWTGESYVWTQTGDTLFLRDTEGKLVLWHTY